MTHTITIDQQGTLTASNAFAAACSCGWLESRWHHADEFPEAPDEASAMHLAFATAEAAGAAHVVAAESAEAWRAHAAARYR
jgi:hypothetical protein